MPPSAEPPRGGRGRGLGLPGARPRRPFEPGRRSTERELSARVGAPFLAPAALALLAGLLAWALWGKVSCASVRTAAAGPEAQVKAALAAQTTARLADVYGFQAGGTAELDPVRFSDVAVQVDGDRARVLAVVEAEGRVAWRDQAARLAYVGREAFSMERCRIAGFCADGRQFEALQGVLTLAFRRRDALDGGDAAAYARLLSERHEGEGGKAALAAGVARELAAGPPPRARVRAWQLRVERGRAIVGEDVEVEPAGGGAPETRRERFEAVREDGRWRIAAGR